MSLTTTAPMIREFWHGLRGQAVLRHTEDDSGDHILMFDCFELGHQRRRFKGRKAARHQWREWREVLKELGYWKD